MERKLTRDEEEERGQSSRISINGKHEDDDEVVQNNHEGLGNLKKEISCHSLYGLLVKSHMDCLKLCLGMEKIEDDDPTAELPMFRHRNVIAADRSELDQFMEAYCVTLNTVKEVMEKPQQESMEFINHMYSQLHDLLHLQDFPSSSSPTPISRPELMSGER